MKSTCDGCERFADIWQSSILVRSGVFSSPTNTTFHPEGYTSILFVIETLVSRIIIIGGSSDLWWLIASVGISRPENFSRDFTTVDAHDSFHVVLRQFLCCGLVIRLFILNLVRILRLIIRCLTILQVIRLQSGVILSLLANHCQL